MQFKSKLFAAVAVAVLVLPGISYAQAVTNASLQAEIASLLAAVQQLETQLAGQGGYWCYTFNTNLSLGMSGAAVTALQTALQKDGESVTVNGSFGARTATAVTGFQEKYASQILAPSGLQSGTGYAGRATRSELNSLYGCGSTDRGIGVGLTPARIPITNPPPAILTPIAPPIASTSTPRNSVPVLAGIAPSSGPDGTQMTLTGLGFTSSNEILFGGDSQSGVASSNGTTLTYTVPSPVDPCLVTGMSGGCPGVVSAGTLPGVYPVSVENADGTSNIISFTVTPSMVTISIAPSSTNVLPTTANPAYGSLTMAAGATDQRIGSYVVTNPTQQNIGIESITIGSGVNGNLFQNMNVNIGNNQFGTTQTVVGNNDYYTFSGGSFVPILTSRGSMTIDVYADAIESDQAGSSDATVAVTCAATIWEGTGTYSCSPSPVFGQTVSIDGPTNVGGIQITDPAPNTQLEVGQTYQIQWTQPVPSNPSTFLFVDLEPVNGVGTNVSAPLRSSDFLQSQSGGVGQYAYSWTVPNTLTPGPYRIEIAENGFPTASVVGSVAGTSQ